MPICSARARSLVRSLSLLCLAAALASCKAKRPDDELWEREDYNTTCTQIAPNGTPNGCGCFRWLVKTGTDKDVGAVNTTPVDTTIAALRTRAAPSSLGITTPRYLSGSPYQEVTTYKLTNIQLTGCRSESDGDYHVILADGNDATMQMDGEMPSTGSPDCVGDYGFGTPLKAQIAAARSTFVGSVGCATTYSPPKIITLAGVGFFDTPHGQTGGAPNGIEIHPVTAFCLGQDCQLPGTTVGSYTVGGSITGLSGTGLQLANGADVLTPAANATAFTFPTKVQTGSTYNVTVGANPTSPWQTCTPGNSSGTMGTADVTTVAVACVTNQYTVSANVSGLAAGTTGIILQSGADQLPASADGLVTFPTKVASGQQWSVTVKQQPTSPAQTCTASAGGAMAGANVTATVTCTTQSYFIKPQIVGLDRAGLKLTDNGGDEISVPSGATSATFPTKIPSGGGYAVAISAHPTPDCSVSGGSGTVGGSDVTSVVVNCTTTSFTVGGTISGLLGSVVLHNGADDLTVSSNGGFAFPTLLLKDATYSVSVQTQPAQPAQTCTVANGTGTVSGNVSNVTVTCSTNAYAIKGTVSGLKGSGLQLQNGAEHLTVPSSATAFAFTAAVPSGGSYAVTVAVQPGDPVQTCAVANGAGEVGSADVTNVSVTCSIQSYRVAGTIAGLEGDGLVLRFGFEDLLVSGGAASFAFATPIPSGQPYVVTVQHQPNGPDQTCTLANASGTIAGADANVQVTCVTGATSTDAGTPDAGPVCQAGTHLSNGQCVPDTNPGGKGGGCSSAGATPWALLLALLGASRRRRRQLTSSAP